MDRNPTEPWLRGTITDVHPVIAQLLYSFEQAREDLEHFAGRLSNEEIWRTPYGLMSVGAHVRHIGGSTDRLLTYADGRQLSLEQMHALKRESEPGSSTEELLRGMDAELQRATERARTFAPETFKAMRKVGRKQLPTTVGGLLVHIAEHTQRHTGQAIVTAKIVQAANGRE